RRQSDDEVADAGLCEGPDAALYLLRGRTRDVGWAETDRLLHLSRIAADSFADGVEALDRRLRLGGISALQEEVPDIGVTRGERLDHLGSHATDQDRRVRALY